VRGWTFILIGIVLVSLVSGCITQEPVTEEKIGVIVTVLPQAEFVERVGGDNVQITVMVAPGASPLTYEPTPKQLQEVSRAKIYFKVGSGLGFESVWMDKLIAMNPDMLVIDGSDGITKMGTDPHIWNSPVNAKQMVENFYTGLIQVDPASTDYYTANENEYLHELDALDEDIHEELDGFTHRAFMIYHPAFGYFASEYNLTQLAIEQGGKEPTPQVIQTCIDKAEEYNLSYIYVAPQFSTESAETIAHAIGGQTLFIDPLPRNYIANMRTVASSLSLECKG